MSKKAFGPILRSIVRGVSEVLPAKFRSRTTLTTTEQKIPTLIAPPALGDGVIESGVTQKDTGERLLRVVKRDVDEVVQLDDKKTNQYKQVVNVTQTLQDENEPVDTPSATKTVAVEDLGNSQVIESVEDSGTLFGKKVSSKEIPDLVPIEMRAAAPTTTVAQTVAGTIVDPPVLSTGDLKKVEEQLDLFTKRVETSGRAAVSLPVTLSDKKLTTEFGGGLLNIIRRLDAAGMSLDEGLTVVDSVVKALGNGQEVRETSSLNGTEWPELLGTDIDDQLNLIYPYKQKVVAAGTVGGFSGDERTKVKPLDKWRSIQITTKIPLDTLNSLSRSYPTVVNHIFPDKLTAASVKVFAIGFGFDAALEYQLLEGYRGPCDGHIDETYTVGPAPSLPKITKFFPEAFMATAFYWQIGDIGDKVIAYQFKIPISLHYPFALTSPYPRFFSSTPVPGTNPPDLPHGRSIVIDAQSEPWRFGVWRNKVVNITVP